MQNPLTVADRPHVGWSILLEQQFQRINIVELDSRHAADESVVHRLVFADVHVLNVVKLCVGGVFDVEVILFRLVVVHRQHHSRPGILPLEAHVVILAEAEVLVRIDQFLPLEPEIEDDTQMAGIRDHD